MKVLNFEFFADQKSELIALSLMLRQFDLILNLSLGCFGNHFP